MSPPYRTTMGAECGEYSWTACVKNKEYIESYQRFKERGNPHEVWFHELVWERPADGKIIRKQARAWWLTDHEILGEIQDLVVPSVRSIYNTILRKLLTFAVGVLCGYGAAILWPISMK